MSIECIEEACGAEACDEAEGWEKESKVSIWNGREIRVIETQDYRFLKIFSILQTLNAEFFNTE